MIAKAYRRMQLTDGEQGLVLAYIGVALGGAGISFNIVNQLEGNKEILRALSAYDTWMVIAGMIGAIVSLYSGQRWLGNRGWTGLRQMLQGMVAITFTAAVVGGTLALPLYGTMFGPMLLVLNLWAHPMLAAFWTAILIGAHGLYFMWRRERESLFVGPPDDGLPI